MKKVIKGKMYNTDTAIRVAYWWPENSRFNRPDEELFKKKTGEYFLWVNCLPYEMSFYDPYEPQQGIVPVTELQAKEWVEYRCNGDKYVELFGEVEE